MATRNGRKPDAQAVGPPGPEVVRNRQGSPGPPYDVTEMEVQPVQPLDLDLPLSVSPAMVSPTRRILEAKLGLALDDEDAIFRVAMTAHELLENAAKYASDGKARLEVRVSPREEDAVVRVVVTNNSTPDHIRQLEICYAEMKAMPDAMAHYFALMRQNAKSGAVSRLGLARVRAEGEMELDVDIQGPAVKIVASGIVVRS